jgi:hypothetical protein
MMLQRQRSRNSETGCCRQTACFGGVQAFERTIPMPYEHSRSRCVQHRRSSAKHHTIRHVFDVTLSVKSVIKLIGRQHDANFYLSFHINFTITQIVERRTTNLLR